MSNDSLAKLELATQAFADETTRNASRQSLSRSFICPLGGGEMNCDCPKALEILKGLQHRCGGVDFCVVRVELSETK